MSCLQIFHRCLGEKDHLQSGLSYCKRYPREDWVRCQVVFRPIQDGIQQYVLDEDVCREFERDSRLDLMTPGDTSLNFAVFSIHDELIGPVDILENMPVCQRLGYSILIDVMGGHRLDKNSIRKVRDEIFKTDFEY